MLTARILDGLGSVGDETWHTLADKSSVDTSVFLTPEWQRSWWLAFGRGRLLPIIVERSGRPVLLATLFIDGGMAFFVGAGGSDYLDFVGDSADEDAVVLAMSTALESVPSLLGVRLHHVLDESPTVRSLETVASRLGLELFDEGSLVAPLLDIEGDPISAGTTPEKKSLVRHERWFRRTGVLQIEHLDDPEAIEPHLDAFFDQHVQRWAAAGVASQFVDPTQRDFFRSVVAVGGGAGWLRFTRVVFDGHTIATHLGFSHRGSFLWYKPTFDIEFAKRSPGEVLIRSLLLEALDHDIRTFDLGLGDEPFKQRFANDVRTVRTWGLYPFEDRD